MSIPDTYDCFHGRLDYLGQYPGLDESGSAWLVEKGIKIFGVDSPSPDNPISRTYPCHMMCREHGIAHYENPANLDQLVGRRFTFVGCSLRIRGGIGSPVRPVAVLDEQPSRLSPEAPWPSSRQACSSWGLKETGEKGAPGSGTPAHRKHQALRLAGGPVGNSAARELQRCLA
jgi:hypothetical protein